MTSLERRAGRGSGVMSSACYVVLKRISRKSAQVGEEEEEDARRKYINNESKQMVPKHQDRPKRLTVEKTEANGSFSHLHPAHLAADREL